MGWWKVQGTENLVGDDVFSVLRDAAIAVNAEYRREFDRSPTRAEWEVLLHDALEPIERLDSPAKESILAEGGRPTAVTIELD